MAASDEHAPDLPECPAAQGSGLLPPELRAWMLLLAATGAVEQRLRSVVKERLDVSHDEFLVLCLLAEQPREGLRMTRIAELLGRPKTRLTYQIACLQHAGLVTRKSVCGDKRGIEVALTDKARRLLREASEALSITVTEALAHVMGPAQRDAVCGLLPDLAGGADPGSGTEETGTAAEEAESGTAETGSGADAASRGRRTGRAAL
ncbi:MarR family winged helix-turn-helix transcriptional regulator [Streptomyces sp. NPDC014995]|uniref:MarR family winged helix-turn-helix transcriptional regulator n=1 Tax=Streptomyces sp. NPDC014995 TaxID=3364936 RepID=UPI00370300B5